MNRVPPLLGVLLGLALLTGCVELPEPVTGQEPPRPSLTLAQAGAVLGEARTRLREADRGRDAAALPRVLSGQALEEVRTSYDLGRLSGRQPESELARFTLVPVHVWSTDAGRYPQQALVESRITDRHFPRARLLHRLVRADAGARWLVSAGLYPDGDRLRADPGLVEGVASAVPEGERVGGVRVDLLSANLVAALGHPGSSGARRFAGRPRRAQFADVDARSADDGEKEVRFSSRDDPLALRTADGGAVVLVGLTFQDTVTARPQEYLTMRGRFRRAYPGEYSAVSQTGLATCLREVPARGRIRVASCTWGWGRISTSPA